MNACDAKLTGPLNVADMMKQVQRAKASERCELANIQQVRGFAHANKTANKGQDFANLAAEPAEWDALATPPKASPLMYYGPVGRLAQQATQGTEVSPVAAMAGAMTWLSACMGRNHVITVGDDWHHLRLYTLHVGRSSRGGKGMALSLLKRIQKGVSKLPDGTALHPKMHN